MRIVLLVCFCFLTVASAAHAVTFADVSVADARKRAAAEKKWVMIDVFTTWCGPCKQMDQNTWPDDAVTRLVDSKCVAVKVDAEKEAAVAARYNIESFPTVLILKPDGTEAGRIVGYHDPKSFIKAFNVSLDGNDALARARSAVATTGGKDPAARMDLATSLANAGRHDEALAEYLWCFDHGAGTNPDFDTLRLTRIPRAIRKLSRRCPAAHTSLDVRASARETNARAGIADENALRELIALNEALTKSKETIALLDSLPRENKSRPILSKLLVEDLIEAKRYGDVLDGIDPLGEFNRKVEKLKKDLAAYPPDRRRMLEPFFPELVVDIGGTYFEALAGVHRDADARKLGAAILEITDTPGVRETLTARAQRAGGSPKLLP